MSENPAIKILCIEDDKNIAEAVRLTLERQGYRVDTAGTGEQGLERFAAGDYDLVCSDYKLPGLNGIEVARRLLMDDPLLPIVIVTGSGDQRAAVESLQMGVMEYVVKDNGGIYLEILPSIVKQALSKAESKRIRENAEKAVEEKEALLNALFNNLSSTVFTKDLDGRYTMVNQAFLDLHGIEADRVQSLTVDDIHSPDKIKAIQEHDRQVLESLVTVTREIRTQLAGDDYRTELVVKSPILDAGGKARGILAIQTDITENKRAESDYRAANERNRLILESAGEGIYGLDLEGRSTFVNPAACKMLGYDTDELIGQPMHTLIHHARPDGSAYGREECPMYAAFTDGKVHHVLDEVLWRKDGTSFPIEYTSTPIRKEGALVGAVVTFKDITERKWAEEELKASEERIRAILGSVVDGMITIDEMGIIQTFNDAAVRMFGYQPAEVVGRNIKMLMPEPDKGRHDAYLANYLRTGEAKIIGESREVRGRRKDGSVFPMSLAVSELRQDGEAIFTGIVRDITRFKAAEDARRESEERLATAIETIGDGFALYDSDDRLVLWNSKFVEIFSGISDIILEGVRFEDIIRIAAERSLIPEAQGGIDEWVEKKLKDRKLPFNVFEQELDGGRWIRTLERRTWDGGRVAVDVDITPFKQAEEQMRYAREQAEAANLAKSEFLSKMSHELRTPMNAILGFGQLLKYETKDPLSDSQRDSVEQILKGGEHLLDLINEILDLAKIEARKVTLSIEEVPLGPLIEECLTLIEPLVESYGIQPIIVAPAGEGHRVHADYTRVKQVLLNLLSNAIKYNRAGGTVTISSQQREDGMLRISVADTGPGIPEDQLESLFEPFNRLGAETTEVEGTGIGLTLTRELAGLMNGRVSVESTVGEGSVFSVDLPRTDPAAPSPPPEFKEPPVETRTLLYVEDNPANMRLMEEIIDSVPRFRLVTANNAEDGIRLAASRSPDIIVMDINLPGMDGYEALKCLKGSVKTRSIPVIALSANAMPADIQKGRDAGFLDYLTKPVKIDEFLLAVEQVLVDRV